MAQASALHSSGEDLAAAEELYRKSLAAQPRHANALHQLGALLAQRHGKAKLEEARQMIHAAIQLLPSSAKFRNSLGVVLLQAKRCAEPFAACKTPPSLARLLGPA